MGKCVLVIQTASGLVIAHAMRCFNICSPNELPKQTDRLVCDTHTQTHF